MRDNQRSKNDLLTELNRLRGRVAEIGGQTPLAVGSPVEILSLRKASDGNPQGQVAFDVKEALHQTLVERYAPPSVVVTARGDIVLVTGRTGDYLEPAEGTANWNICAMAREGLAQELSGAIQRSAEHKTAVFLTALDVKTNCDYRKVNVAVNPLLQLDGSVELFVITFDDVVPSETACAITKLSDESDARCGVLEKELAHTREMLQATLEKMESMSEDLKSANEELQSTNEELTTSEEELRSINEEQVTLNTILQSKLSDVTALNNDIVNLMDSTQVATVFLDGKLNLKRFTPAVVGILNLRAADVGRPITDITHNLIYSSMERDIIGVLETLAIYEGQVESEDGRWFTMRIMPYRTLADVIDGAVVTFTDITRSKRVEETLRSSEETFFKVFHASPTMIIISTLADERRMIDVNQAFERHTGYRRDEVIGRFVPELGIWADPEELAAVERILYEKGSCPDIEASFRTKTGETRIAHVSAEAFELEGQRCVLMVAEDITERKRGEEVLRESEERYRSLFENMMNGFAYCRMIFDGDYPQDFIYLAANDAFEAHTGLKNVVGRKVSEVIPGIRKSDPGVFEVYGRVARSGKPERVELYVEALQMWFDISVYSPGKDHFVAIFDVVSERKRAEIALRESEERFRRLFDLSPLGAAIAGLDYRFTLVNEEFCRMTGYSEAELLSLRWQEITHPDDLDMGLEQAERLLSGEIDHFQMEKRYVRKDGEIIWASLSTRLLKDAEGRPLGFLPLVQDITEQRQLQAQLHRSHRLEAVGNMAGGIAHEFKNLLMAISGYSEVLQVKLGPDHPQYGTTNDLLDCVDRASKVIGQLLTFSRRQATSMSLVDLSQVVRDSKELFEHLLGEHIAVEVHLPDEPVTVKADPSQIEQVIVNLAINARDAMPSGGKLGISVSRLRSDQSKFPGHTPLRSGEFAELRVWDTGAGMDEATKDRVFEPFFTTKDKRQRSGLGLSVAYGIIKQHKGEIHVFSALGEGTAFHVYLPFVSADAPSQLKTETLKPTGGQEHILLVEDEESVRKSAKTLLENYGYTVLTAGDHDQAVGILQEHWRKIDLAILDAVVPGGSGNDLLLEAKKLRPDLKTLVISGYGRNDMPDDFRPNQKTPFLAKPFSLVKLAAKVRELLDEPVKDSSRRAINGKGTGRTRKGV